MIDRDCSGARFDVGALSQVCEVKRLDIDDIPDILALYGGNPLYFEYCGPPPTAESAAADMAALPPGVRIEQKFFVGYYSGGRLAAVLDLILGYPCEREAYIGLFMTDASVQGRGFGSSLVAELALCLGQSGFRAAGLAFVSDNPQASHFWLKNGFVPVDTCLHEYGRMTRCRRMLQRFSALDAAP